MSLVTSPTHVSSTRPNNPPTAGKAAERLALMTQLKAHPMLHSPLASASPTAESPPALSPKLSTDSTGSRRGGALGKPLTANDEMRMIVELQQLDPTLAREMLRSYEHAVQQKQQTPSHRADPLSPQGSAVAGAKLAPLDPLAVVSPSARAQAAEGVPHSTISSPTSPARARTGGSHAAGLASPLHSPMAGRRLVPLDPTSTMSSSSSPQRDRELRVEYTHPVRGVITKVVRESTLRGDIERLLEQEATLIKALDAARVEIQLGSRRNKQLRSLIDRWSSSDDLTTVRFQCDTERRALEDKIAALEQHIVATRDNCSVSRRKIEILEAHCVAHDIPPLDPRAAWLRGDELLVAIKTRESDLLALKRKRSLMKTDHLRYVARMDIVFEDLERQLRAKQLAALERYFSDPQVAEAVDHRRRFERWQKDKEERDRRQFEELGRFERDNRGGIDAVQVEALHVLAVQYEAARLKIRRKAEAVRARGTEAVRQAMDQLRKDELRIRNAVEKEEERGRARCLDEAPVKRRGTMSPSPLLSRSSSVGLSPIHRRASGDPAPQ